MSPEMTRYLVMALIVVGVAGAIALLPAVVWAVRFPFLLTNRVQWMLSAPVRHLLRTEKAAWPRVVHFLLAPLTITYGAAAYVALAPVRLLNAVYFNMLLYWSVSLRDALADLVKPEYDDAGSTGGYIWCWISRLPARLLRLLARLPVVVLQGIWTSLFDLVWPTLTLFHGTRGDNAVKIARSGEWLAGGGDWVGTGVYFAISSEVASHYAGGGPYVLCRVTLTPARSVATLARDIRNRVGSWQGDAISAAVGWPWASLEHWREDGDWYEFCLLLRTKYVPKKLWRVRPICIIREDQPERIPLGTALWPNCGRGAVVLASTLALLIGAPAYHLDHPQLLPQAVAAVRHAGVQVAWAVGAQGNVLGRRVSPPALPLSPGAAQQPQAAPTVRPTAARGAPTSARAGRCPNSPATQLRVGGAARIADMRGDTLRVRNKPGLQGALMAALHAGVRVSLLEGPVRADSINWWRVSASGIQAGWVAESASGRLYLLPD